MLVSPQNTVGRAGVAAPPRPRRGPLATADAVAAAVVGRTARHAHPALRLALALVFGWFGLLKVIGESPVAGTLVAAFPFVDPDLLIPGLGVAEIALGVGVAVRRFHVLAGLVMAAHLCATFVTFALVPHLMFGDGNPLLLTTDGEFVVKNLILVTAILALVATEGGRRTGPRTDPEPAG
jgi:uncharacterized membrane protein YkgB